MHGSPWREVVWRKERERERETDRQTEKRDRQTNTQTETDRDVIISQLTVNDLSLKKEHVIAVYVIFFMHDKT